LFNEKLRSNELPWYYIPGWIFATTPALILALFIVGTVQTLRNFLSNLFDLNFYRDAEGATDLYQLAIVTGSVLAVIILGSVLYDSWRHLYFIYPAIVYLATLGLHQSVIYTKLRSWGKITTAIQATVGVTLAYLLGWCIWMHPLQYNYFSFLAGDDLEKRYEVDYWGVGYQPALRWILEHDKRETIRVYVPNYTGQANSRVLPEEMKHRIIAHGNMPVHYDYFISNFRFPEARAAYKAGAPPFDNPVHLFEYEFGRGVMIAVYGPGGLEK
jgi:hypothetical protein